MGFCRGVAKIFLLFFTGLVAFLGLGTLAYGAYVYTKFSEYSDLLSENAVFLIMIAGLVSFLIAFVGYYGAKNQSRCALYMFLFVMVILILVQFASGLMFLSYMGHLDDVTESTKASSSLADATDKKINDFILSTYGKCCPDGETVPTCSGTGQEEACIWGDTMNIDQGVCSALEELVADDDYKCTDKAVEYERFFFTYLQSKTESIGYYAAAGGGILFLSIVFTCVLLRSNEDEFYDDRV